MKLAWLNIIQNRVRFAVTELGIGFAAFLMIFQGSLLCGFLNAAARMIDATESDIWITARGVVCFDFAAPLSRRILDISRGVPGVRSASRMVTAMAEFRKPDGEHQLVALVGADPEVGYTFPIPRADGASGAADPESVLVDRSNAALLGVRKLPLEIEINRKHAKVHGLIEGFNSFLGCPYVFASFRDAARYLGIGPEQSMYILLRLEPGYEPRAVRRILQARFPEVDVWTREEFARQSKFYWMTQTGAGGGILTAAVLGFLIGLVVASQTTYATTMENLEEFATLKALGASGSFIVRLVLLQCLILGFFGCAAGLLAAIPAMQSARAFIPWIYTPAWLPGIAIPLTLLMCCGAGVASVRAAVSVEPAKVFRA